MKRVLLTFMAAAATVAATAQDIYKTDFSTEDEFLKWTVIDANEDNTTWKFDAEGSQSHVYYPYSATNQADDWLVSPVTSMTIAMMLPDISMPWAAKPSRKV